MPKGFYVRLSQKDKQKLEELAKRRGMTASDIIRDMIRTGHDHQSVADALQDLRVVAGSLAAHKGSNNNGDITEIRRIVTLIAMAMPSVAKKL